MINNTLQISQGFPAPLCISSPEIKILERKPPKSHGAAEVTLMECPTSHKADAFTNERDINRIVEYLLNAKQYGKAALFVFGINTGYRCGDIIAFRVKDFYENGRFRDVLYAREDKTNKVRPVYINKAVKTAIEFVIQQKNLTENNYVFRGDGNRKAYITGFKYNKDGELEDVVTSGEKYDANGNEREIAPMLVGSITRWLKDTSAKLGIYGHYSSHAMRKTFAEFIGRDFYDNRNVIAVSAALAHSDSRITLEHYMGIDPMKLREKWLGLNLGFEALENYNIQCNCCASLLTNLV